MSGNWTDPRYAELVAEVDKRRSNRREGQKGRCLGAIVMVDPTTRQPIPVPCPRFSTE